MKLSRLCLSLYLFISCTPLTAGGDFSDAGFKAAQEVRRGMENFNTQEFGKDAAEIIQQTVEHATKDLNEAANTLKTGLENTGLRAAQELTQNPITIQLSIEKETADRLSKFAMGMPFFIGGFLLAAHATKKLLEDNPAVSKEVVKIVFGAVVMFGSGYWIMH